jgi:hypothetical protein
MNENVPAHRDTFDLTTEAGRKRAAEFAASVALVHVPGVMEFLLLRAAYYRLTRQGIDTMEAQKTTAIDLIKAGSKQQDLDEMKITMDQKAGLDLGSEVEGIPIKAKIGKSGHMIVEAKYKR